MITFSLPKTGIFSIPVNFVKRIWRGLMNWIFPKRIHLVLWNIGTKPEGALMKHMRDSGVKCVWYMWATVDEVSRWNPNQLILVPKEWKTHHRGETALFMSKKYGVPIKYFDDVPHLKRIVTKWAKE